MNFRGIDPASNLATLASINPFAAMEYADAILRELADLVGRCSIANVAAEARVIYAEVHALKGAVSATGDLALIDACAELMAGAARPDCRQALAEQFRAVAEIAAGAVTDYRDALAAASSTEASLPRPSGL